jgi:predicted acyl esterase
LPPDPEVRPNGWRDIWLERLAHATPVIEPWLSHQRRDAYWKHASVGEDLGALRRPTFMVGGWADAYHDAILRVIEGAAGPVKGLIGPWAHTYPFLGVPGPAIGFLQEAIRWWDHWLRDDPNEIMDEPALQVWMQDSVAPDALRQDRSGRWLAEPGWPADSVSSQRYWLAPGALRDAPDQNGTLEHRSSQAPASDRGNWCPGGWALGAVDLAGDQRIEDAQDLRFTTAPLVEPLELLGFPRLQVRVTADRPQALLMARMCDVAPDGSSTLISRGVLNLTHRAGNEDPAPLAPGEPYDVQVVLGSVGYRLAAGHRLRVALATTYWPWVWPSPEIVTLSVHIGDRSRLDLPVRAPTSAELPPVTFSGPESAAPLQTEAVGASNPGEREIRRDVAGGTVEVIDHLAGGAQCLSRSGLTHAETGTTVFSIGDERPLSARIDCNRSFRLTRGDWDASTSVTSTMSSTATQFHVTTLLEASEHGCRIFAKTWSFSVARDQM